MKNTLYLVSILAICLIAGSVFYYLVIFLPNKPSEYEEFNKQLETLVGQQEPKNFENLIKLQ